MKESIYKTYDDLPLFLNAGTIAKVLGISAASSYELMYESDFPVLRIGSRMVVPKGKFIAWIEQHTSIRVSPCEPVCGPTTMQGSTDHLRTPDRRREPFVAECEGHNPAPPPPGDRKVGEKKEKQEKALALSQRQSSHFHPQCGRLRERRLTLFREVEMMVDACFPKNATKSRCCKTFSDATTKNWSDPLTQSTVQGNQCAQFLLNHQNENLSPSVLLLATHLLHHMSRIFRETPLPSNPASQHVDSKLMRRIREKKIVAGHKPDNHEEPSQGPVMSM